MPDTNHDPKPNDHGSSSQSAEDEPYQHGPLSGQNKDDSTEKVAEDVRTNRTSVGKLPNVPDKPITQPQH